MFVHVLWAVSISLFCALPFPCPPLGHSDHSWPPPIYPETCDVSGRCHAASWSPWWPAQSCPGATRCLLRWFLGTPCSHSSWDSHTLTSYGMYESLLTCQRGAEWRTDHWGKQQVPVSCWSKVPCLLHTRRKYAWDYSEIPPLLVVQFQKPDSQEPIHLNGFECIDCLFRIPPPVWSWGLPLGLEAWRQVCEYSQSGHTWARRPSWGCSAPSSWHPPLFSSGISHF